jgi:hypothetical protein
MRRIATFSALAALLSGVPLIGASAGEGYPYNGRRAPYLYGPAPPPPPFNFLYGAPPYGYAAPYNSWALWRGYYNAQADISFARRNFRANYHVGRGYNPPTRHIGPPTNYYAERYSLEPYSFFDCPLARRGEGICANQPALSAVPQP